MTVELYDGKYRGFQLNKPEYTAYPEENEFLLLDGADVIIQGLDYLKSEKYNGTKYLRIKMSQINNWKEDQVTPTIKPPNGIKTAELNKDQQDFAKGVKAKNAKKK